MMVKIDIPPHGAAFRYMVHRQKKKGKDDAYAAAWVCVYIVVVCACVRSSGQGTPVSCNVFNAVRDK